MNLKFLALTEKCKNIVEFELKKKKKLLIIIMKKIFHIYKLRNRLK